MVWSYEKCWHSCLNQCYPPLITHNLNLKNTRLFWLFYKTESFSLCLLSGVHWGKVSFFLLSLWKRKKRKKKTKVFNLPSKPPIFPIKYCMQVLYNKIDHIPYIISLSFVELSDLRPCRPLL